MAIYVVVVSSSRIPEPITNPLLIRLAAQILKELVSYHLSEIIVGKKYFYRINLRPRVITTTLSRRLLCTFTRDHSSGI